MCPMKIIQMILQDLKIWQNIFSCYGYATLIVSGQKNLFAHAKLLAYFQ